MVLPFFVNTPKREVKMDYLLKYDNNLQYCDWVLQGNDFEQDKNLETLCLCALFTDQDWYGQPIGSNLSAIVDQSPDNYETFAESTCQAALEFLLTLNIVDTITVDCKWQEPVLQITCTFTKGQQTTQYDYEWSNV